MELILLQPFTRTSSCRCQCSFCSDLIISFLCVVCFYCRFIGQYNRGHIIPLRFIRRNSHPRHRSSILKCSFLRMLPRRSSITEQATDCTEYRFTGQNFEQRQSSLPDTLEQATAGHPQIVNAMMKYEIQNSLIICAIHLAVPKNIVFFQLSLPTRFQSIKVHYRIAHYFLTFSENCALFIREVYCKEGKSF